MAIDIAAGPDAFTPRIPCPDRQSDALRVERNLRLEEHNRPVVLCSDRLWLGPIVRGCEAAGTDVIGRIQILLPDRETIAVGVDRHFRLPGWDIVGVAIESSL